MVVSLNGNTDNTDDIIKFCFVILSAPRCFCPSAALRTILPPFAGDNFKMDFESVFGFFLASLAQR